MAEGLLRALGDECFEALSAGTEATQVRPLAIRAMAELGIDISGQDRKTLAFAVDAILQPGSAGRSHLGLG